MTNKYVPDDLSLMESLCVNWTLAAIKKAILTEGIPSGQAIDQAIEEAQQTGLAANHQDCSTGEQIPA